LRFYLVDLPGYGFARGGTGDFAGIVDEYFAPGLKPGTTQTGARLQARPTIAAALFVLDARHPGLTQDVATLAWLDARNEPVVLVATKIDKLTRAERVHALRAFQDSCKRPVLPVSAETGEGMDALWTQIVKRLNP
jgi:GTP-binding protein